MLELIAAQHQNPEHHPHHPLADAEAGPARYLSAARSSAIGLADPALYPGRRSSVHDVAHLPPPMPRRVSHTGAVVAVAPEGVGFPAERSQQQQPPAQPALRPKVFCELHNTLMSPARVRPLPGIMTFCSYLLVGVETNSCGGWCACKCTLSCGAVRLRPMDVLTMPRSSSVVTMLLYQSQPHL